MKSSVTANVFAAKFLHEMAGDDLDGRLVVESVTGEEDGATGSSAAALSNPYPFERDAAIVTEPTEMQLYSAIEGNLFERLTIFGRSAHAGTRWKGVSVLPYFEQIREEFEALEAERDETVKHSLYEEYEIAWPVNFGIVKAGSWPSSVPARLVADIRIGFAPGETLDTVESEFSERLDEITEGDEWLSDHPPTFERYRANTPSAEVDPDEPVVRSLQTAMESAGLNPSRRGATFGSDAVRYNESGDIPSVVFGPGSIEQAHQPNETIDWREVLHAGDTLVEAAQHFLR